LENLTFAGRMSGVTRPCEQAKQILASAGLKPIADRPVRQLSQGVRQRLAIARAVIHQPRLILLDEPFASLDAQGRRWLEQRFNQWRHAGRTVCFAGHDALQSRGLADRIVSLEAGRIITIEPTVRLATCSPRSA
jgi:ABC-type nitrate/sulfonate/bicarbonate transport system ATPase subunit